MVVTFKSEDESLDVVVFASGLSNSTALQCLLLGHNIERIACFHGAQVKPVGLNLMAGKNFLMQISGEHQKRFRKSQLLQMVSVVMDIHRCRFVPHPAYPINSLSFSHPSANATSNPPASLRLAVGRANGDIEIWNPQEGAWFQESILRGGKDRSIECLTWIQDPDDVDKRGNTIPGKLRLFSSGYSQVVTEWDLATGRPLKHSQSNHGEIWCLAAQPKDEQPTRLDSQDEDDYMEARLRSQIQNIAVGCADGSIVILSTDDEDLHFRRVLARPGKKKSRVLSITFQNRNTIIAGHADSTIRIYDIRGGQTIQSMSLGGGHGDKPQETLVWSVKCLRDGTIVSGDSNGVVSFWDGKHYALSQRIEGHEADVLDLATSADGRYVFSGGMDRRTCVYQKRKLSGGPSRWGKMSHTRLHRNDVKTMATYEAKNLSIMASGGLDTNLIVTPIQQFGREHSRNLSNLPQLPQLLASSASRLLVSWWDRELKIWSILGPGHDDQSQLQQDADIGLATGRRLLTKIMVQGEESITSASLADDGSLLVVATNVDVKMFRLGLQDGSLKVRKMKVSEQTSKIGAKMVQLSSDNHWLLLVTPTNSVKLVRLVEKDDSKYGYELDPKVTTLHRLRREFNGTSTSLGCLGRYDRYINRASFSHDGRILAVSDISGCIDTWILENGQSAKSEHRASSSEEDASSDTDSTDAERDPENTFGERWIRNPAAKMLPHVQEPPLVLSFRSAVGREHRLLTNGASTASKSGTAEDRLLVVTARNHVYEFNVLSGRLSDWSRHSPPGSLPSEFQKTRDPVKGLIWDVIGSKERAWLYGVNWLRMFDLSKPFSASIDPSYSGSQMQLSKHSRSDSLLRRKRGFQDWGNSEEGRRGGTGAGDRIKDVDMGVGIGRKIRRIQGGDTNNHQILNDGQGVDGEQGSDEEDEQGMPPTSLPQHSSTDPEPDVMDIDKDEDDVDGHPAINGSMKPSHWHTYKYRPILGILPIGVRAEEDGKDPPLEVALVERPLWDLDLPPAYHGKQEWDS